MDYWILLLLSFVHSFCEEGMLQNLRIRTPNTGNWSLGAFTSWHFSVLQEKHYYGWRFRNNERLPQQLLNPARRFTDLASWSLTNHCHCVAKTQTDPISHWCGCHYLRLQDSQWIINWGNSWPTPSPSIQTPGYTTAESTNSICSRATTKSGKL